MKIFLQKEKISILKNKNGNRGINARKYDTRRKVICKCCGSTYVRCVEKIIKDKPKGHHYLICSYKKRYTKKYYQSENINIEILEKSKDSLETLLSSFIYSTSKTMQYMIKKKM